MEQGKIIYPFAPDLQISPLSSLNFEHDWRRLISRLRAITNRSSYGGTWIRVQYAATDRYSFKACITWITNTGSNLRAEPDRTQGVRKQRAGHAGKSLRGDAQ